MAGLSKKERKAHEDLIIDMRLQLQRVCILAAQNVPVDRPNSTSQEPWGCILEVGHSGYCDECPVQRECPYPGKKYSK
jgi:hypothetical protein